MTDTAKLDKGVIVTNPEECKGCGLCVEACTPGVLRLAEHLNRYGYHPAIYIGHGCTACGLCFYVCPEPGGIRVYKRSVLSKNAAPVAEPVLA
jgi:2-oxoglutarate ferredoxin oxidoreductase subunit delta